MYIGGVGGKKGKRNDVIIISKNITSKRHWKSNKTNLYVCFLSYKTFSGILF